MSRTNLTSDASQSSNKEREIVSRSDGRNNEHLLGLAGLSLQDKGWISPPDSIYCSSSESVIISDGASLTDSYSAPIEVPSGSNILEGVDCLNSVSCSGTDFHETSLYTGQPASNYTGNNNSYASSTKSPTNESTEHLKAAASPKNEAPTVIDTSSSLNEDFEDKDEISSSNQAKIEDENRGVQLPNTDSGRRIARGKNYIIPC